MLQVFLNGIYILEVFWVFLFLAIPIFILPKIGVSATLSSMIFGQIILALILDHFGFMGNPTITIDLKKILGAFLLLISIFLINSK